MRFLTFSWSYFDFIATTKFVIPQEVHELNGFSKFLRYNELCKTYSAKIDQEKVKKSHYEIEFTV